MAPKKHKGATLGPTTTRNQDRLERGVFNDTDFAAGMSAPHKSSALLRALCVYITDNSYTSSATVRGNVAGIDRNSADLLALLAEPGLSTADLTSIANLVDFYAEPRPVLLAALCAHPGAGLEVTAGVLWRRATPAQCADIAVSCDSLLATAISWWRTFGPYRDITSGHCQERILATCERWTTWAGTDPARRAFLIAHSGAFVGQGDLLAAGDALCAPATSTG